MGEQRMSNADNSTDAVQMRILRALEARPEVSVPAEFAARVAAHVPVRREAVLTPARYGMIAVRVAMAVLVVALVIVTMRSGDRGAVGLAVEWILGAQLVALALWRSGVWRRGESRL